MWITAAILAAFTAVDPQSPVAVWSNGAPGSEGKGGIETSVRVTDAGDRVVSNVHNPTLTPYLPKSAGKPTAAVIIAPGGGHRELWTTHEGHNIARWLSDRGVAAFVLEYRLAREKDSTYTIEGHALADTRESIRLVRANAVKWNVNPAHAGVMGFSAGGELAALAAGRPDDDASKPGFQALIYPAIPKDLQLSKDTPPAFLACGENDRQNISQGLPELYLAMKKAGASAELHVYAGVGHGFGLRETLKGPVAAWLVRFHEWMTARGFVN
jgi:endo-1,4-beta-xylanase